MKKHFLLRQFLFTWLYGYIAFLFLSCSSSNNPSENIDRTLLELLSGAPSSIFDQTTEGISTEEKQILLNEGESESWKRTVNLPDRIKMECKFPTSNVLCFLLKRRNAGPLLVVSTQNEQASSLDIWQMVPGNTMEKIALLPVIDPMDFFKKENQPSVSAGNEATVSYYAHDETLQINASLNTWMNKDYENHSPDFTITLNWDTTTGAFVVRKTGISKDPSANAQKGDDAEFRSSVCHYPGEFKIHPPKKEGVYPQLQDELFFPVGVSEKGVFAYFKYQGEMDPCECVFADLKFYSIREKSTVHSIPFRFETGNGEDEAAASAKFDRYQMPENVWEQEQEKYCRALKEQGIISTNFDVIHGEELMTIAQLKLVPANPDEKEEGLVQGVRYQLIKDGGEIAYESPKTSNLLEASLNALIRYKVGEEYYFVAVIGTLQGGFEGSGIRSFEVIGF